MHITEAVYNISIGVILVLGLPLTFFFAQWTTRRQEQEDARMIRRILRVHRKLTGGR